MPSNTYHLLKQFATYLLSLSQSLKVKMHNIIILFNSLHLNFPCLKWSEEVLLWFYSSLCLLSTYYSLSKHVPLYAQFPVSRKRFQKCHLSHCECNWGKIPAFFSVPTGHVITSARSTQTALCNQPPLEEWEVGLITTKYHSFPHLPLSTKTLPNPWSKAVFVQKRPLLSSIIKSVIF